MEVAARYPAFSLAWALLAEDALAKGSAVEGYAYARTGYHRGLDALRRNGWKGHGPVPWSHAPNQGFLRCLAALARAAGAIGEAGEASRCWTFLRDSSAEAYEELKAEGVAFVGLNTGDPNVEPAQAFERTFGISYPSLFDDQGNQFVWFESQPSWMQ